jgi:hypothetical protein
MMDDDAHATAAEAAVAREVRLSRLEEDLKKLRPQRKDGWERLQAVTPLVSGLLVAIVGYFLTGSVNNAIQRQQLQLSNVKEMRELLAQLNTADANEAEAAAFTLSAFGRPAVPALMAALLAGGEVRAPAAERALRAIGLNDSEAVCEPTRKVLDNRTGRFSWVAHLSAIRLLGDLECRGARASVESYAQALGQIKSPNDVSGFASRVDPDPPLDLAAIEQLQSETTRTLRILRS